MLHRRSLVTGKPEYWTNFLRQRMKAGLSATLISTAIGVVVGVVVGTFFARILLVDAEGGGTLPVGFGGGIASLLTAVQIQVMSMAYKALAQWCVRACRR